MTEQKERSISPQMEAQFVSTGSKNVADRIRFRNDDGSYSYVNIAGAGPDDASLRSKFRVRMRKERMFIVMTLSLLCYFAAWLVMMTKFNPVVKERYEYAKGLYAPDGSEQVVESPTTPSEGVRNVIDYILPITNLVIGGIASVRVFAKLMSNRDSTMAQFAMRLGLVPLWTGVVVASYSLALLILYFSVRGTAAESNSMAYEGTRNNLKKHMSASTFQWMWTLFVSTIATLPLLILMLYLQRDVIKQVWTTKLSPTIGFLGKVSIVLGLLGFSAPLVTVVSGFFGDVLSGGKKRPGTSAGGTSSP